MPKLDGRYDYIIVGNSAAGVNAAEALRSLDEKGSLAIFGEEDFPVYSRPMISNLVAGEVDFQTMRYRKNNFYKVNKISFFRGVRVTKVNIKSRTVVTSEGLSYAWKKLLLATGSLPFQPPIEGLEEIPYHTFINYRDAQRLIRATRSPGVRALVIGAGLIGVKAAEALHARGAKVTVVEMMERILPAALDEEASRMVQAICDNKGLHVITGESVRRVSSDLKGKNSGGGVAELRGGEVIDFDLLVVAVGVVPRLELARQAGLDVNRGVLVDQYLRTSHEDIYAAGDVAEAFDLVWGEPRVNALWPNATLQGRYAGWNMANGGRKYPGSQSMNSVEFFGLPVLSAGIVNPPDDSYEVLTSRVAGGGYRKVVLRDDVLVGMLVAGEVEKAGVLTSLIQEKARVRRFKQSLLSDSFGHVYLPKAVRQARVQEGQAGILSLVEK